MRVKNLTKTVACVCFLEISKDTKNLAIMLTVFDSTWCVLENMERGDFPAPYNSVIPKGIDMKFGILR